MKIILLFVVLAFSDVLHAQELPEAPKPKSKKIFYAGVTALAAAKTFDAVSTMDLLNRGGWESANPLLGMHPSTARLVGVASADFAAESSIFYFTEKSHRAWIRWSGRVFIGFLVEQHIRLGTCNSRINTHSPTVQACH